MKKIVFILVLSFVIAIPVISQEELASTQIIDKVFDRTTEAVQELAQALKVPAEHVYEVLVKQQRIRSMTLIIASILLLIIGLALIKITYDNWMKANREYKAIHDCNYNNYSLDDGFWIAFIILGVLLVLVGFIVAIASVQTIITGFVNPEYGALKEIMNVL